MNIQCGRESSGGWFMGNRMFQDAYEARALASHQAILLAIRALEVYLRFQLKVGLFLSGGGGSSAPALASSSTFSFPSMPKWPSIHLTSTGGRVIQSLFI